MLCLQERFGSRMERNTPISATQGAFRAIPWLSRLDCEENAVYLRENYNSKMCPLAADMYAIFRHTNLYFPVMYFVKSLYINCKYLHNKMCINPQCVHCTRRSHPKM